MPPNEVPDSDDESGIENGPFIGSATQELQFYSASAGQTSPGTTSGLDVNFDEFLTQSQSQKLKSSQNGQQDNIESHIAVATQKADDESNSTGSTEKLRRENKHLQSHLLDVDGSTDRADVSSLVPISSESPNVAKLKRRRIATAQPGERVSNDDLFVESQGGRRKRARTETYSKKTRLSNRTDAEFEGMKNGIFVESSKDSTLGYKGPLGGASSPERPVNSFINPSDMHVDLPGPVNPTETMSSPNLDESTDEKHKKPNERDRNYRVSYVRDETPSTVTTHSTMGGYQIYNIDYRNHSSHSAFDSNPFADELSQQLVDDEGHDAALTSRELYKNAQSGSTTEPATSFAEANSVHDNDSANNAHIASSPASALQITQAETSAALSHDGGTDELKEAFPKSRTQSESSRKRTNTTSSRNSERSSPGISATIQRPDVPEYDQNIEEYRNATSAPKKRGRKPKSKDPIVSPHIDEQEGSLKGLQSDDLDVGLPKEQYKPRPSRSRGGTSESLQEPTRASKPPDEKEVDTPVNLPSSEPNFSDDISFGDPKEQYKPRPSRSRSKRTEELEDDSSKKIVADSSQQSYESSAGMPPPPKRAKKASKTKVKRAKTSAAFLKKSDMLDEDDKDVLWVDKKPASVKMQLPEADFSPVKKEEHRYEEEPEEEPKGHVSTTKDGNLESTNVASKTETRKARLTVEISPPDPSPAVQGPKKRGRKRKKTDDTVIAEDQPAEQVDQDDKARQTAEEAEGLVPVRLADQPSNRSESSPPPNRLPLTEKSPNIASAQSPASKSNEIIAAPSQENAPADPSTPSPPETPDKRQESSAPAADKGPAKHSPIKTGSLFGSQYRVGLSRRQRIPRLLRIVRK
ncbi:MAG: hypothetical protein Q9160_000587 [Pyrenula sp. 1 TL-2023]